MDMYVVDITSLTNPCITRSRGREAALKLSSYVDIYHVVIDLCNAELVSLSYLDELICYYLDSVNKGNIIFISNKNTDSKLSRIAAVRAATIHCRNSQNKEYIVPAECYLPPTPILADSKS